MTDLTEQQAVEIVNKAAREGRLESRCVGMSLWTQHPMGVTFRLSPPKTITIHKGGALWTQGDFVPGDYVMLTPEVRAAIEKAGVQL